MIENLEKNIFPLTDKCLLLKYKFIIMYISFLMEEIYDTAVLGQ